LQFLALASGGIVGGAHRSLPETSRSNAGTKAHRFPISGLQTPDDVVYTDWHRSDFRGYTVPLVGDVESLMALSLSDLLAMEQRAQTTGFSCIKGWHAMGTWRGVGLRSILAAARPMRGSRFVVFHSFDRDSEGTPFYESLEIEQAYHRDTLLALELNDRPLGVVHGGPVRLHVPTQPGYKNVKWLRRIEVVSSLEGIGRGRGGYWEDKGLT
jgi:DMSO/TMAO reductase YedYZ molybdopterin-dependent catalytic subunit